MAGAAVPEVRARRLRAEAPPREAAPGRTAERAPAAVLALRRVAAAFRAVAARRMRLTRVFLLHVRARHADSSFR
jgi:hypothetical protein